MPIILDLFKFAQIICFMLAYFYSHYANDPIWSQADLQKALKLVLISNVDLTKTMGPLKDSSSEMLTFSHCAIVS